MFRIEFLLLITIVLLFSCDKSQNREKTFNTVDIETDNLLVKGANYINRTGELLTWSRFSEEVLSLPQGQSMFNADKARTNSGVRLLFKTKSEKIKLVFNAQPGDNRGAAFAINQNGQQTQVIEFNSKQSVNEMEFEIENQFVGKATLFAVVMPSWANVALSSMELYGDDRLETLPVDNRLIYLAIGNSITHGVGQGSATFLTYPYLLAKAKNYDYYNLAVGGAKISPAIARMTSELPQADVITILIGYNDLMFNDKSVEEYTSSYLSYLKEIRKNQRNADIYCITLTFTRAIANERTGITPDEFRTALKHLVYQLQSEGDNRLHLIEGEKITSEANLRAEVLNDKVHFGIEGAALFAKELEKIIQN